MRSNAPVIMAALSAALPIGLLGADPVSPPPSIVRIALPAEGGETRPFTVPTAPEDTLEIDFPWPVEDWAGRGFTPDPEKFAGDFVVEARRGTPRIFVTPVAEQAHRVLHVVLDADDGHTRSVPIELVPAPLGDAWHSVVFVAKAQAPRAGRTVSLGPHAPRPRLREASPESELGLIRTMRLMVNSTAEEAESAAAANPALDLSVLQGKPRSFGDFTLTERYALRDSTTGALGLCVSVANATARRILFDPESWVVRAGDRIYPVRTVDFPGELEPGASAAAFLVLADNTGLMPDNPFAVSAVLAGSVNPRPVHRIALGGLE